MRGSCSRMRAPPLSELVMISQAITFAGSVSMHLAAETPVSAAVAEIPAFAALLNGQADGVGANTYR